MTRIRFFRDANGRLCGFSVAGHAGQAAYGSDIVCAGVSALAVTAVNALESVAGARPLRYTRDGVLRVWVPQKRLTRRQARDARIILRTARRGFADIAAIHPRHVKIST